MAFPPVEIIHVPAGPAGEESPRLLPEAAPSRSAVSPAPPPQIIGQILEGTPLRRGLASARSAVPGIELQPQDERAALGGG